MVFSTTLPSDGSRVRYRPFIGSEEKALLAAAEAGDTTSIVDATIDLIESCVIESDREIKVRSMPFFDVEHLLLKIRAKSIGEKQTVNYRHTAGVNKKGESCSAVASVEIDLDSVEPVQDEKHNRVIEIGDGITVKMRYPTIADATAENFSPERSVEIIARCIEGVFRGEELFSPDTEKDTVEWILSMSKQQREPILEFFKTMPRPAKTFIYTCPGCGQIDEVTISGLHSFF